MLVIFMMKRILICLIFVILLAGTVNAAGIKWSTQSESMLEGETKCINYGVYNPFGNDVMARLSVEGNLSELSPTFRQDDILVNANTYDTEAISVEFCFTAPQISEKNCILGIACEHTCDVTGKVYKGSVIVTDKVVSASGATGSKVSVSASAPLDISVSCIERAMDYLPIILLVVIIIIIILLILLYKHKQSPASIRRQKKIDKLKEELSKEESKNKSK